MWGWMINSLWKIKFKKLLAAGFISLIGEAFWEVVKILVTML